MKVTLNLALLPSRRERYALSWAVPLALLGTVGLVFLIHLGIVNVHEYRRVQNDILQTQDQNQKLAQQEIELRKAVEQPDYQAVSGQAQYLNSRIEEKKSSVADLVVRVGELMPEDVRLSAMSMKQTSMKQSKGSAVSFTVVGRDEEALEEFLTALEDSTDFQDIAVSSEGFQGQGDANNSVTITCTAQYVGTLVP